jgi:serine/threonine protein kinase
MERLSGRTLRDVLAEGPMPPERVRDVGLQVLRALAAAHELGIVHRDVKPGNVLDAGVGTWKVADFGIAKWIHADETLTGTGELLGSPSYLAPERIDGEQAGPAADLYAVGVLLYEALCGRRPFEGDDPFTLASAIKEGRYERPADVVPDADPRIAPVIERAMSLEPGDRFASAEEMASALLGADADETEAFEAPASGTSGEPPASAPDHDADATETIRTPRLEETARIPYQAPAPRPVRSQRRARTTAMIVAAALIAIALITVLAVVAFTGSGGGQQPGSSAGSSLPAPLEDSLRRLEEAVRP